VKPRVYGYKTGVKLSVPDWWRRVTFMKRRPGGWLRRLILIKRIRR